MISTSFLEQVIKLLNENNNERVIELFNQEIDKLKKAGKMNASKKLFNISKKIDLNKKEFSGVTTNSRQPVNLSLRDNTNLVNRYHPDVSPEQVVLNFAIKNKMQLLFQEWEDYEKLAIHGLYPTNKILFYGPPGTGKTLLANAIANQLGFPLILVKLDEIMSYLLGETGKNIRDIFELARREPIVLFLDEVDTIAKFRSDEKELGELKRIVVVLLQHIDFFPNNSILIAATNHEEILDKALWRRFPLKIEFDLPDVESRKLLFKLFLGKIDHSVDFNLLSDITAGLNGSDIFDIVQSAKKQAVLSKNKTLTNLMIAKSYLTNVNLQRVSKKSFKASLYTLCQQLKNAGLKLREIEAISGIAYTTLRDNLK